MSQLTELSNKIKSDNLNNDDIKKLSKLLDELTDQNKVGILKDSLVLVDESNKNNSNIQYFTEEILDENHKKDLILELENVSNEFQMKLIINRDNMYYNYITEKAKAIELTKQEVEKTKQEEEKTKQVGLIEQTKQEKFKMIMLFVQKDNNFDFNKYISIL